MEIVKLPKTIEKPKLKEIVQKKEKVKKLSWGLQKAKTEEVKSSKIKVGTIPAEDVRKITSSSRFKKIAETTELKLKLEERKIHGVMKSLLERHGNGELTLQI